MSESKLYIQIEGDKAISYPALEENLIEAFGTIPNNWETFEMQGKPFIGPYEVFLSEEPKYEKIEGIWKDIWNYRAMTNEEKLQKQEEVKSDWASNAPKEFSSWTFDEELCRFVPPPDWQLPDLV